MREPDISGTVAKAWRAPLRPPKKRERPEHEGTVALWFLNGHPFWEWWDIAVVHLRDIPGVPPAVRKFPSATHEIMVWSIHPEHPPDVDHPEKGIAHLEPVDVVEQFEVASDRDAERLLEAAVSACCDGMLSPDQDYRALWHQLISGTAACFRSGTHEEH